MKLPTETINAFKFQPVINKERTCFSCHLYLNEELCEKAKCSHVQREDKNDVYFVGVNDKWKE